MFLAIFRAFPSTDHAKGASGSGAKSWYDPRWTSLLGEAFIWKTETWTWARPEWGTPSADSTKTPCCTFDLHYRLWWLAFVPLKSVSSFTKHCGFYRKIWPKYQILVSFRLNTLDTISSAWFYFVFLFLVLRMSPECGNGCTTELHPRPRHMEFLRQVCDVTTPS